MRLGALIVAAYAALTVCAVAQDRGGISDRDVISQPVMPAPENGESIILPFGAETQIYFRNQIKKVTLDDPTRVKAEPRDSHIVAFTALAPGRSSVTVESSNGHEASWNIVTVVREPHEVRIFTPSPSQQRGDVHNNVILMQGDSQLKAADSAASDYKSVLCNEVKCTTPPPAK